MLVFVKIQKSRHPGGIFCSEDLREIPGVSCSKVEYRSESDTTFLIRSVLPLFTVVQIGPGNCVAPSGEVGNCLPNSDCAMRGGKPTGPCAGGFGLCCVCMIFSLFINLL